MATAHSAAPLTDAEIIAHYRAQTLLRELRRPLDTNEQEALHVHLAMLHNAGSIDMLAITATPEFLSLDRPHFFTIQRIYCGVMPLLEAPGLAMLEMVQRLVTLGANHGLAATPRLGPMGRASPWARRTSLRRRSRTQAWIPKFA